MEKTWQRPRTQKVYLHAPLAERLVLLWPDFKITNYEFADNGRHTRQESTGVIFLYGQENQQLDYSKTTFLPVEGKLPVYTLVNDIGCRVELEAFCDFSRNPTVYVKLALINDRPYPVAGSISILARTGDDLYLSSIHDTGYSSYQPNVGTWYLLKKNWTSQGLAATDGSGHILLQPAAGLRVEWVEEAENSNKFAADRYFRIHYELAPGQTSSIQLAQRYGQAPAAFDYAAEKLAAAQKWDELLGQIRLRPATPNQKYQTVFQALVIQCLQMLARYTDQEWVIPRQGDLGCFLWPWEAAHFLIPLDRIGLSQYTGQAYRFFVERWMTAGGKDDGRIQSGHQPWGNLNGSIIWGVSEHLLHTRDQASFAFFKPYLDRCLDWIQRQRKESTDSPFQGIFPVGKATDWNDLGQFWIFTDGTNVRGIRQMARLYEYFQDPAAAYVKSVYEEYLQTLQDLADRFYAGHAEDAAFILPHQPDRPFADTESYCFTITGHPHLYELGILDPRERRFEQMENYFRQRGLINDSGLMGRMTNVSGGDHGLYAEVYYTVNGEKTWIEAWLKRGEQAKADKAFAALMQYCLTKEYIVSERYSPYDEWFSPWQPNASSSGRIISLMLAYFGEHQLED